MATITLRPTSASGTSWSNIANAYDGDTTTSATVATTSSDYSSMAGTFTFDTSVIPSGSTINSATLYVNCKSSNSNRTTLYADINGNSSNRVINERIGTSQTNKTANITSYMSSLNTIKLMQYNSKTTSYTFTLYEIYIEVDYTVSTTYTVRFLDYNGRLIDTQTVIEGGSATQPEEPYRDGYVFTGWDKPLTNITANTDITAQYSKIWSVTFKDWDGSLITSQNVIEGQDATPPTPTRDGYRFKGWDGSYTNVTENRTLTAQYVEDIPAYIRLPQDTIEVPVGETVPLYVEHNCEDCFVAETNPLESPYITMDPLQGYQITDRINITGVTAGTTTTITIRGFIYEPFSEAGDTIATVHVVAASKPTYTVTFKDWNDTVLDTQTVEEGGSATAPSNPTRDGYRFTGWSGSYTNITADTDITAQYIKLYSIVASAGTGGTISPDGTTTVDEGSSQSYTISANNGYGISDVKVDNISQGIITTYTFSNITANHSIEVIFIPTISKQKIFTPASIDLDISNYLEENSPFSNALGKGSDNEGDYAEWSLVTGGAVKTYTCWTFDLSSIPSNATITNITCSARCSNTNANITQAGNTTVAIGVTDGSAYVNKQDSSTPSFGTEATVVTVSSANYTREELDNFRLKIQAARGLFNTDTSYYTKFYGATLTIDYAIPADTESTGTYNIKIGDSSVNSIYIGDTKVVKVYLGDTLMFEN